MKSFSEFRLWWNARSSREQFSLSLLAIFLLVTVCYSLVYLPVQNEHDLALKRYESTLANYQWAGEKLSELEQSKQSLGASLPVDATPSELKKMLEKILDNTGLKTRIGIIQTSTGEQIKIEFRKANGQAVMRFIEHIVKDGFSVQSFNLKNTTQGLSGSVSVKV